MRKTAIWLILLMLPFVVAFRPKQSEVTYLKGYHSQPVVLPIDTPQEAIDFALQLQEVKCKVSKEGKRWINAARFDPRNFKDVWVVAIGNGEGECASPYQCFIRIHSDGRINFPLKCSDGWRCK